MAVLLPDERINEILRYFGVDPSITTKVVITFEIGGMVMLDVTMHSSLQKDIDDKFKRELETKRYTLKELKENITEE